MLGYGQYCPLALASEIVGERWTPLVLRELLLGARRFNDIHRGVPRMSPSLLARRLRRLEKTGIVARRNVAPGHVEYALTEAGRDLAPAIENLAIWGKRWLPATLSADRADPDLILWDMHRRMHLDRMPEGRTVIRFTFTDQPESKRNRWIVNDSLGVGMCVSDPGFDPDLYVDTDSRTITWVWYGDMSLSRAIGEGRLALLGPQRLTATFPTWLQFNILAEVPRRCPLPEQ